MPFQPAATLRTRTFTGLLIAQFFAAFNDQAIHASAMFFAINTHTLTERDAISLMPILFYAPWAIFCTLAGYLADRYSKRASLVFWKVAEVGITLVALAGFWLGVNRNPAGPWLVLSTVFLMGMHSAFFVPAKYGAMPEILQAHMLSRGNGMLESLSFLAVILGTVFGGVLSEVFQGQEYWIGIVLVILAIIGAVASLMIRRMPAANPNRPFPAYLYKPLWESMRGLLRSRPLAVAVVGIAFFTFLVAFMRGTVYMHGESQVPRWHESKTSIIVGMVALGIGIGSPLVGFLSGGKVELGLVPIGALGMVTATLVASAFLPILLALVVCIIAIGFFTGFYIVPLFTLLQHRAPKASKGDAIATSNFINVTGAMAASLLFFVVVFAAQRLGVVPELQQRDSFRGVLKSVEYEKGRPHKVVIGKVEYVDGLTHKTLEGGDRAIVAREKGEKRATDIDFEEEGIDVFGSGLKEGDPVMVSWYTVGEVRHYRLRRLDHAPEPVYDQSGLPRYLFAGAGLMTLLTLLLLWRLLPDLFTRTAVWLRSLGRYRLEVAGMNHLPGNGPVLLATNAEDAEACQQVLAATDRTTRFVHPDGDGRKLAEHAAQVLRRGQVAGLALGNGSAQALDEVLSRLVSVPVLPVRHEAVSAPDNSGPQRVLVMAGDLLPAGTTAEAVRQELQRLGEEARRRAELGPEGKQELAGAH